MCVCVCNVLKRHKIDLKANLVGQGYDGASVMSGRHKGGAVRIKQEAPFVFYVHCHAHRLNLVLVDVIKSLPDDSQFFSLLEKLCIHQWFLCPCKVDRCTKGTVSQ